jgi:carboxypeptidase Q
MPLANRTILLMVAFWFTFSIKAQPNAQDSLLVRKIFDEALVNGECYENLKYLCEAIGHRLSGSPQASDAIRWGQKVMEEMNLDRVYLQDVEVTHWERGDKEWAAISEEYDIKLNITTLGGSVSSDGPLQAKVIEVNGIEELASLGKEKLEGKIIFYNKPMDPKNINTFESYGGCVSQRYWGASEAAAYGAVAVLVRSMTTLEDDPFPHTGSMGYKEGIVKIPAVAISTKDANMLHHYIEGNDGDATVTLNVNPTLYEPIQSYNVIGEIKGSKYPDKIITVGGHLDSWDVGQGAHDDGAGVVHSMEALRILKAIGYKPECTIRVVLFMNEENGNGGGKGYARHAKEKNEFHVAAIESDRGGFSPRGFSIDGDSSQVQFVSQFRELLEPYGLHFFEKGYGGVDIGPLKRPENYVNPNVLLMGLVPDPQRYFDYHHSEDDVFENVNKRELELGSASMASMIYLLDKYFVD